MRVFSSSRADAAAPVAAQQSCRLRPPSRTPASASVFRSTLVPTDEGLQICGGCGSALPAISGPTHEYMSSSPACWGAFNTVLAREYADPELMKVHRLTVDAWAAQHPGDGSRRAIQSVGLHLARLMIQLETGLSGERANAAMLRQT